MTTGPAPSRLREREMSWIFDVATGRRAGYALGAMIVGGGLLFGVGPFVTVQELAGGRLLPEQQL
ncbi:MAG: hypothetical protein ACR2NL_09645, partial [Acidimicrobiia bacterium]